MIYDVFQSDIHPFATIHNFPKQVFNTMEINGIQRMHAVNDDLFCPLEGFSSDTLAPLSRACSLFQRCSSAPLYPARSSPYPQTYAPTQSRAWWSDRSYAKEMRRNYFDLHFQFQYMSGGLGYFDVTIAGIQLTNSSSTSDSSLELVCVGNLLGRLDGVDKNRREDVVPSATAKDRHGRQGARAADHTECGTMPVEAKSFLRILQYFKQVICT